MTPDDLKELAVSIVVACVLILAAILIGLPLGELLDLPK